MKEHSISSALIPSFPLPFPKQSPLVLAQGNMGGRVGLIFLFALAASWTCDARNLEGINIFPVDEVSDVSVLQITHTYPEGIERKDQLCMLCEEYAREAQNYLAENKTKTEIISILHKSCSKLHSLTQQCITLVDYYAPLFFLEISSVQPGDFCQKVDLCEPIVSYSRLLSKDSCGLCQQTMAEILMKLKDPDTQLEIIELLLKGCDSVQNYVKKCKRMVFEYGPLVLTNAEQFLETNDLCTAFHACKPSAIETQELLVEDIPLLSKY